jgi:hypothetical protein
MPALHSALLLQMLAAAARSPVMHMIMPVYKYNKQRCSVSYICAINLRELTNQLMLVAQLPVAVSSKRLSSSSVVNK